MKCRDSLEFKIVIISRPTMTSYYSHQFQKSPDFALQNSLQKDHFTKAMPTFVSKGKFQGGSESEPVFRERKNRDDNIFKKPQISKLKVHSIPCSLNVCTATIVYWEITPTSLLDFKIHSKVDSLQNQFSKLQLCPFNQIAKQPTMNHKDNISTESVPGHSLFICRQRNGQISNFCLQTRRRFKILSIIRHDSIIRRTEPRLQTTLECKST